MPSTIDITKPTVTGSTFGTTVSDTRANFEKAAADVNGLEAARQAHEANVANAHGIDALIASKADYIDHKANTTTAHGIDAVAAVGAANLAELQGGRGVMSSLANRLDVALQSDGKMKISSLATRWIDNSDIPTYVSATSFTVPGDRTKVYLPGTILRLTVATGYVYGIVLSASFGSVTTVTLEAGYAVLLASLSKVELALYAFANNLEAAIAQNAANIVALQSQLTGQLASGFVSVVTGYTIQPNDRFISLFPPSAATITVTLPALSSSLSRLITFKKTDTYGGNVIIQGNANIDGVPTLVLSAQFSSQTIFGGPSQWLKV